VPSQSRGERGVEKKEGGEKPAATSEEERSAGDGATHDAPRAPDLAEKASVALAASHLECSLGN
jgi:hypothetical protein